MKLASIALVAACAVSSVAAARPPKPLVSCSKSRRGERAREAHRAKHTARSTHIALPSSPVPPLAAQKYNTAAKRVEGKLNVHIVREYARAVDSTAGCGEVHFNFCLKREPKDPLLSSTSNSRSAHAR